MHLTALTIVILPFVRRSLLVTAEPDVSPIYTLLTPENRPYGPCVFSYCSDAEFEMSDLFGPPASSNVAARIMWQECSKIPENRID